MKGIIVKSGMALLLLVLFISCSKEEVQPNSGEKIAQDLRTAIGIMFWELQHMSINGMMC
jgi:hypothetical protein